MKDWREYEPELEDEVCFSIPDHQVLLSFIEDEHSYAFNDWWGMFGKKEFLKWVRTQRKPENRQ